MLKRETQRSATALEALEAMVAPAGGLGLSPLELEELLVAVQDRADVVAPDRAALLARGRVALELELAATLER